MPMSIVQRMYERKLLSHKELNPIGGTPVPFERIVNFNDDNYNQYYFQLLSHALFMFIITNTDTTQRELYDIIFRDSSSLDAAKKRNDSNQIKLELILRKITRDLFWITTPTTLLLHLQNQDAVLMTKAHLRVQPTVIGKSR